ncbi:MAG: phosphoribosylamine--glycine ligase [Planctomycetota bacterium]
MNILVIGGGGREHALSWLIKKSCLTSRLFAIPGNAGISEIAECVEIPLDNFPAVGKFVNENNIELVIVGPEKPLADGIVDFFDENLPKVKIFGPNKNCAKLESSKAYTRELCAKKGIPHPHFNIFTSFNLALKYIASLSFPVVIKADGLAGGKGTIIAHSLSDAKSALETFMIDKKFGVAGTKVIIEDFIEGKEASYMLITDNESLLALPPVRDFKKLLDNNRGPNTGGMGAISPLPDFTIDDELETTKKIILPALSQLKSQRERFKGVLYAGLIKNRSGIKLLEYNVRFGDPEIQCLAPLIETDIVDIILKCIEGKLKETQLKIAKKFSCCVCLVSAGYPDSYTTGYEISGLDKILNETNVVVFHAGTKKAGEKVLTSGGRVLNVVGLANTPAEAVKKAYEAISKIHFDNMFYRKDIRWNTKKSITKVL